MDSYEPKCTPLKLAYEQCHKAWLHDEYLPLAGKPDTKQLVLEKFGVGYVPCKELFEPYSKCINDALRGIPILLLGCTLMFSLSDALAV